jgi:hypothetical protein
MSLNEEGDSEVDDDYVEDLELRDEGCLSSLGMEHPLTFKVLQTRPI